MSGVQIAHFSKMDDNIAKVDLHAIEQDIISLQEILEAFNAPLNEEQAWALCYQCGKFLIEDTGGNDVVRLEGADGVLLGKDGSVRLASSFGLESTEVPRHAENELINSLGRTIYHALDYGLSEEEERELSHPLEEVIEFMTACDVDEENNDENRNDNNNVAARDEAADSLNVDEGIEDEVIWDDGEDEGDGANNGERRGKLKDSGAPIVNEDDTGDSDGKRISELLKLCSRHLPQPSAASSHYQAVCRAVYAEYQDLATFLKRITGSKEVLRSLSDLTDNAAGNVEDLHPRQWAKIWLNVVRDLRNGVKLKKMSEHEKGRAAIEYALTPYEMLMDDIRSRRYSLNKVMVDGKIPTRVKKEAHDIVLDFIRSRPPLKPVPREKLNRLPLRSESGYEKLMNEIRSMPELKPPPAKEDQDPTVAQGKKRLGRLLSDQSESGEEDLVDYDSPQLPRKVLKAEFTLDWSEEESESETSRHESDSYSRPRKSKSADNVKIEGAVQVEDGYDEEDGGDILERAIQKILDDEQHSGLTMFLDIGLPRVEDTMPSTPEKTLTISRSSMSSFDEIQPDEIPRDSPRRHSIGPCQSFRSKTKSYQNADCLSLTVEEVVHIRSVLVKAEIENLRVNLKLYKAVLQDKVCFSCKKKFSLFKKKIKCRLCKKLICAVCCVKMYIPKEEFLHIPIESLTPKNSPAKTPSTTQRHRSISDPPTPFFQSSPMRKRKKQELHVWRAPASQVENVCCECCTFLKNTRTGPLPTEGTSGFPTPFSLAPAPLQKMNSISS